MAAVWRKDDERPEDHGGPIPMISADAALERLREGNRRFVAGRRGEEPSPQPAELVDGQEPFAIVLGCSDSRVPAELVFDQGLGDLFVIRVAGNIVAPTQVGSVEFAAEFFHTRLVVVLGHTRCGAVMATLQELQRPSEGRSPNLQAIVDRVRPAVEGLLDARPPLEGEALIGAAVRANIRATVDGLRHASPNLEQLIVEDGLLIVGAEYSLETGEVEFLESEGGENP